MQYINSEARRLLGIHTTALDEDLIHQMRHYDALALREAIDTALRSREPVVVKLATIDTPADARRHIEVTCRLVPNTEEEQFLLLAIVDVTEREELRGQIASVRDILDRLTRANEEVIAANQHLTHTITRLRAENDDLLVASEEIQAATEEVETLNEELQASNEELETLNEELQATVEELNATNDDLENRTLELQEKAIESEIRQQRLQGVLDSIDDAIVVVDQHGVMIIENAAYRARFAGHRIEDVIRDDDGEPFTGAAHPLRRVTAGESFSIAACCGTGEDAVSCTVRGHQVTSAAGEQFGLVTMRIAEPDR